MAFHIKLSKDIVGGFVAPNPKAKACANGRLQSNPCDRALVEIKSDDNGAIVTFNKYKGSKVTSSLQGNLSRCCFFPLGIDINGLVITSEEVRSFVSSLENELRNLPTEQPKGSEDIYGLSKSISFRSGDFHWENGKPFYFISLGLIRIWVLSSTLNN
ncbi:hypothetical protein BC937DRAFT_88738 [Endogone sp. FLAS-F59071]|nr:hypothetical protein BC937DRAFT_88738 [Endogone sp. FLAS-F59071]|eukprot:RUS18468.1 hypothetical protein BC937DRAFT_88738 [Endogone sp. FLAS-F59071]